MEVAVLAMLRKPLAKEFGIDGYGLALVASAIYAGMIAGSFFGGYLSDVFGRRSVLLVAASIISLCGVGSAFAPDVYTFGTARMVLGIGIGAMVPISYSLMLEWTPTLYRGSVIMTLAGIAFHSGAGLCGATGSILISTVGGDLWWRVLLVACTLPVLIALPFQFIYLPESLHWLVVNGKLQDAKNLLRDASATNGQDMLHNGGITTRLYTVGPGTAASFTVRGFVWDLSTPELRLTTCFLIVAFTACGFIYNGFVFIYPQILLQLLDYSLEKSFALMTASSALDILCIFAFIFYMDLPYIGRRGALLTAYATLSMCALLAAIALQGSAPAFVAVNVILKAMVTTAYTVTPLYAGELLPTSLRASTMSLATCCSRVASMASTGVLTLLLSVSVSAVYLCYFLFGVVAFIASFVHSRETLGMPLLLYSSDLKAVKDVEESQSFASRYFPIVDHVRQRKGFQKYAPII